MKFHQFKCGFKLEHLCQVEKNVSVDSSIVFCAIQVYCFGPGNIGQGDILIGQATGTRETPVFILRARPVDIGQMHLVPLKLACFWTVQENLKSLQKMLTVVLHSIFVISTYIGIN